MFQYWKDLTQDHDNLHNIPMLNVSIYFLYNIFTHNTGLGLSGIGVVYAFYSSDNTVVKQMKSFQLHYYSNPTHVWKEYTLHFMTLGNLCHIH